MILIFPVFAQKNGNKNTRIYTCAQKKIEVVVDPKWTLNTAQTEVNFNERASEDSDVSWGARDSLPLPTSTKCTHGKMASFHASVFRLIYILPGNL